MHELSIAEAIITELKKNPVCSPPASVKKVHISVGALSGVAPDPLSFCLPVAGRFEGFEKTDWCIERVPLEGNCRDCGTKAQGDLPVPVCLACGSNRIRTIRGTGLFIERVEVG